MAGGITSRWLRQFVQSSLRPNQLCALSVTFRAQTVETQSLCTSCNKHGRFGHRLVKLWEQPEYTTKPLPVYRTGGRLPTKVQHSNEIVPGRVWTKKLGGGDSREWHWVDRSRLTAEEVNAKSYYQEKVIKVQHDDSRSGMIALVAGPKKERWILATETMEAGTIITNSAKMIPDAEFVDGDAYPVGMIPSGTRICSLEFVPGKGAQIARSAGNYGTILRKEGVRVIIKMPSSREINVDEKCVAVIGKVAAGSHSTKWGSPAQKRAHGIRPGSGRKKMGDDRSTKKLTPVAPMVVIGDKKVLQRSDALEE
uniref:39S ribosomal protein L2, mitochondrial n=1 Tax=Phallusia mammillata TaxID=59560 RepID=A0A6F9DKJ0_9ASCI|nr:39S ribosomal protein L2, mitochondrial [Phallusia mammillata]